MDSHTPTGVLPDQRIRLPEDVLTIMDYNIYSPWNGEAFAVYDDSQDRVLDVFRTKEEAILFVESVGKKPILALDEEN